MLNEVINMLTSCLFLAQDGGTNAAGNCSAETLRRTSQHSQVARDLSRSGMDKRHVTATMCRTFPVEEEEEEGAGGGSGRSGSSWGGGQPYYILDLGQRRLMGKLLAGMTVFCPHKRLCRHRHTHTFHFVSLNRKHSRF